MACFNQIKIMCFTKFIASHQHIGKLCEIFIAGLRKKNKINHCLADPAN